ncbi:MAG: hypothetical protein A2Y70_01845 [Candidatus Aminicenantes bacterium RBG_13_64_14]|nr:MAG: hypothetical protein A2Y70_01845 [Candidatus Aminicenantes bacterium RBG_13_64_14]
MPQHRSGGDRFIWGLIIIAVGVIFLLGNMGKVSTHNIFSTYWPVILIVIGLWQLISSGYRDIFPGLLLIALGVIFLLQRLGRLPHNVWVYVWPTVIIFVGLWLILGPVFRRRAAAGPAIVADDLHASVVLGGVNRIITSKSFRGGRASVVLGGLDIDLRDATLDKGQATIDVSVVMGGIDIKVPRNWNVVADISPVLGGVENKTASLPEAEAKATLYVRGTVIMGGLEVKS